ncbi:MAG: F0F1 ATP synthase subunit delta [Pseudomonadota bacterium]
MSDLTTAARPYARAVFEMARDSGDYAAWSAQLALLAGVATDAEMAARLDAPALSNEQRADMIIKVCGEHVTPGGCNLLNVIAENGRLSLLVEIAALYETYRSEAEGVTEATVVSAQALDEEQKASIVAALSKRLGGEVTLNCETDASLMGGAIVRAGDLVIDGTVKGRLERMAQQLGASA